MGGKVAIWINSPGGNLFAGMQLGRIIRAHGASTHIINSDTLLPGECYSACALTFLGGVYRFNDNGARYGVHRASLPVDRATGGSDLGQDLSAANEAICGDGCRRSPARAVGEAANDEMYVLFQQEAKDLRVVNDGREPPDWSLRHSGRHDAARSAATADGRGTVFFSCDEKQTIFGSVYEAAGKGEPAVVRRWRHVVTIDGDDGVPVSRSGVQQGWRRPSSSSCRPTWSVSRCPRADRSSHEPSSDAPSIGISVDIDERTALMVRTFLGAAFDGKRRSSGSVTRYPSWGRSSS